MQAQVLLVTLLVAAATAETSSGSDPDLLRLVADASADADCDATAALCLAEVKCNDVLAFTPRSRHQGSGSAGSSAGTFAPPEKVDDAPENASGRPTTETTTLDFNSTADEKSMQKRNAPADKCFLAFQPQESKETREVFVQRNTSWQVWLYGFLSVGFISLSGIFGVIFVPLMKKRIFKAIMRFLVGLGIGALSATAILQLIPECFQIMDTEYLPASLVIWFTIWGFFLFESVCKIAMNGEESPHGHSHAPKARANSIDERGARTIYKPKHENLDSIEVDSFLPKSFNGSAKAEAESKFSDVPDLPSRPSKDNKMAFHHRSSDYEGAPPPSKKGLAAISSVAWMIIVGDGIHNFIDGVSIGAGFTQSPLTGVSISLAIIFEEFPHELGDFAILISSGMSVKKALAFNFASACTAFLGLILGIALESFEINSYIFGLAGGLFLYISMCDLIPQLNMMLDEALANKERGKSHAFKILLHQNLGILTGMGLIYVISKYSYLITVE